MFDKLKEKLSERKEKKNLKDSRKEILEDSKNKEENDISDVLSDVLKETEKETYKSDETKEIKEPEEITEEIEKIDEEDSLEDEAVKKELDTVFANDDEIDYDKAINDLLAEDAKTELAEIDYDYINDVSIYDTVRKDEGEEIAEIKEQISEELKEEEEKEKKSYTVFYIIIGALIGITTIMCVVFFIFISIYGNTQKADKSQQQKPVLTQPEYKANNANYIYMTQIADYEGREIKLTKMLVDTAATVFYFDSYIDAQKYNITLIDNNNIMYNMDLSFIQATDPSEEHKGSILRFEPISKKAKSIKLIISNPETSTKIEFPFVFGETITDTPIKYVTKQNKSSKEDSLNMDITIDNAVFSSAGSRIEYTVRWDNRNYSIVHGNSKNDDYISLKEGASAVKKSKNHPSVYSFNNGEFLLGRMDFESVKNLNSDLEVTFNSLYKKYDINKDISANSLAVGGENKNFEINVDNYKIVFEGLGFFDDQYVLVFHGEDTSIKNNKNNEFNNRVEVQADVQLIATADSGMEIVLDGKCMSAQYGTDMVIPINESAKGFLENISRSKLNIRINSVLVKAPDVTIPIKLSRFSDIADETRKRAENNIISSFEDRLAYKSSTKSLGAIGGFDAKLIQNKDLMSNYEPQELTEKAQYSAQIVASCLIDDRYYAVVQEVWKGVNGIKEPHFYRTHKVLAYKTDLGFNIKYDNIIK